MSKSSLFPGKLSIVLQEIKHFNNFISLSGGIHQELFITERTASHCSFTLRNHEDIGLAPFLFTNSEKTHSLISVKSNADSDLTLELVTFNNTFDTVNDSAEYSIFHHWHAELYQHYCLYDICAFLHVEFVRYPEVENTLGGNFCAVDIHLVSSFVHLES